MANDSELKQKGMEEILSNVLEKLDSFQELKFIIDIDTTLKGIPLNDSSVYVELDMNDSIEIDIGNESAKIEIGNASTLLLANAAVDRTEDNLTLSSSLKFKDTSSNIRMLTASLIPKQGPSIKVKLEEISLKSKVSEDLNSGKFPLGDKIEGACKGEIRTAYSLGTRKTPAQEKWSPILECSFVAKYNSEDEKYDVTLKFKN